MTPAEAKANRAAAKAAGLKRYLGTPCMRGHGGERYAVGGRCVKCSRDNGRRHKVNRTPEQIERARERRRVASRTPEQIARRREHKRVASWTPEQIARRRERRRARFANMTPEQLERKNKAARRWRATQTPERAEGRRKRGRVANLTPEQIEGRPWQRRQSKYGIAAEQFNAVLAAQAGRCGICGTDTPGGRGWHVDHGHGTNKVRGILCRGCNTALGHMKDNPDTLRRAARYLDEAETYNERGRFLTLLDMFT